MNSKEIIRKLYGNIETQHERVDDISQNFESFNPVRVKSDVCDVINNQHDMKNFLVECGMNSGNFRNLVERISNIYRSGDLYKKCANPESELILPIDFTKAFIQEARGYLYLETVILTDRVVGFKERGIRRVYYVRSAMEIAMESLEAAVNLSSDTTLAKILLEKTAIPYLKHLNQTS